MGVAVGTVLAVVVGRMEELARQSVVGASTSSFTVPVRPGCLCSCRVREFAGSHAVGTLAHIHVWRNRLERCCLRVRVRAEGKWGEFSNFYKCKQLQINGKSWPTVEHYFQVLTRAVVQSAVPTLVS